MGGIYIPPPYLNTTMWYKFCCHILEIMSIIITTVCHINFKITFQKLLYIFEFIIKKDQQPASAKHLYVLSYYKPAKQNTIRPEVFQH